MPHLSLSLLGTFQATLDGQPITCFATNKVRALLAYLAVESDRPHTRETLAGLLWGDLPNRAALGNLRYSLSNLRQAIGDQRINPPFLLVSGDTIQFNTASDYDLDVSRWQMADSPCQIANGKPSPISDLPRSAARFLDGFSCDSAPFEEWVVLKREQIGQQVLSALGRLTAYHMERGDYDQAAAYARQQIELEPWDEEAHRQLMHALALTGQRSAALAQYETCRRVLKQELGVDLSRETIALYESIRDGTLRGINAIPWLTNVPIPLTGFVGRQSEMAEVKHLLETTRLLTLTGAGGCGKTRLAVEVARGLADANHFKDGVWWAGFAALNDPTLVPQTVASAFGLRELADTGIIGALAHLMRAKELLLVLDNCEHLIDTCARLAETLLSACPGLHILATSREALSITGEVAWRVPGLALPEVTAGRLPPLEELVQYDAIRLFVERAIAVSTNWKLADNASAVARICSWLDGIPLAIELAAARLKVLSAEQIAARLDDRFRLLIDGSRAALPRHRTLHAAIDWSHDLLPEEEQILFRRLSVFAGGWTLEAAEQVTSDDASKLLDSLTHLVDKSLVSVEEQKGEARYRLLETIRLYAREKQTRAHN